MKKFGKFFSLLLILSMILTMLASCEGESAYDIAVRLGFEGDEREWLESLEGGDGEDGKNGENGKDGENGSDGKDGISLGEDVSRAAAISLRSAVSVFCEFEKYQYMGYGRDPMIVEYTGAGAGVIYELDKENGDAYIVTNYHVVYSADSISDDHISENIKLYLYGMHYEEKCIEASFVGGSSTYDIALLKVEGSEVLKNSDVAPAKIADSDYVEAGTMALAVGNPDSKGVSVTSGIISVSSEFVKTESPLGSGTVEMRLMRIDTPVNHGNSGGGLFNENGELIGIVNAKRESTDIENMGYAIPSNVVYAVAKSLVSSHESGKTGLYRASVGIVIKTEDPRLVYDSENETTYIVEKVTVSEIYSTSVLRDLLSVGDVITKISSGDIIKNVSRRFTVIDFILSLEALEEITFTVERGDEILEKKITLTEDLFSRVA